MTIRALTALPVYNERNHVARVLDQVVRHGTDVLVVNDGSTDGTADELARRRDVAVATHERNRGYGAALTTAFQYSIDHAYDVLVTIDCDGQHEPQMIPTFVRACADVDLVSGSRYLTLPTDGSAPPADRRRINQLVTAELNRRLGLQLTDAFCGFKAYRVSALRDLRIRDTGYAMPLELWVQAVAAGWRIVELAVPLIYLDLTRSFGGALDDADTRLKHYRDVIDRAEADVRQRGWTGPSASAGDASG